MGLDTGFKLRIKNGIEDKDIKNKEQFRQCYVELLFFGRTSEAVDNMIMDISQPLEKICYLGNSEEDIKKGKTNYETVIYTKPELPDCDFKVNLDKLKQLVEKIKPLAKILAKYSDRILDDLYNNFEDREISKNDRTTIKDLLFELDENASYDDLFFLLKLYDFFSAFFMSEINGEFSSDLKADLIYWRSY